MLFPHIPTNFQLVLRPSSDFSDLFQHSNLIFAIGKATLPPPPKKKEPDAVNFPCLRLPANFELGRAIV